MEWDVISSGSYGTYVALTGCTWLILGVYVTLTGRLTRTARNSHVQLVIATRWSRPTKVRENHFPGLL